MENDPLEVFETKDKSLLGQLISHTEIIDGFVPKGTVNNFIARLSNDHICYVLTKNSEVCGVVVALNLGMDGKYENTFVADIGFYKEHRGKTARELCRLAINDFFKNHRCDRLIASVKKDDRAALLNARWCGFKITHIYEDKYYLEFKREVKDGR